MNQIKKIITITYFFTIFLFLFLFIYSLIIINNFPITSCGSILDDKIPISLLSATLSQEDRLFFHHSGVDWGSIKNALKLNMKRKKIVLGGSTIDMQVADLCYLKNYNNRWFKKILEIIVAKILNYKYKKIEILKAYVKSVPMGHDLIGFTEASQYYFLKRISKLTKNEQWSLVFTLRNKEKYNPFSVDDVIKEKKLFAPKNIQNKLDDFLYFDLQKYCYYCK